MTDDSGLGRSAVSSPSVSEAVIERVAETLDRPTRSIDPPLNEVIDPDALDRLFAGRDGEGLGPARVTFVFVGCRVVVDRSGSVTVTPVDDVSAVE